MKTEWQQIEEFYNRSSEENRITGEYSLERLRTLDILARFVPKKPSTIYDIGGATGVYSFPLADQGHSVHLIEPVASQVQLAHALNETKKVKLAAVEVGNALSVARPDQSADVVLLLGPLYHLIHQTERLQVLNEAYRLLKPGGIVISAALSRNAYLIHCFNRAFFVDPKVLKMLKTSLETGVHESPPGLNFFTTAYLHKNQELLEEHRVAGFQELRLLGVEGPVWKLDEAIVKESNGLDARLDFLRQIEEDSDIVGASAHMIAIGRKI